MAKCGLKGSPTVVKRVFAPPARDEKAERVPFNGHFSDAADALVAQIFSRQPSVEADLLRIAARY
jgi:electron transfer flavoprotein beta subunit